MAEGPGRSERLPPERNGIEAEEKKRELKDDIGDLQLRRAAAHETKQ